MMPSVLAFAPNSTPSELLPCNESVAEELFAKAMLIRGVEQRLLQLFSEGKLFGTVHTCIGQEWSGIAVAEALRDGDVIFTGHRGHGHFLAFTGDVDGLIAEVMGKQAGVCGGRGGSQHLCSQGVFSNGIQGGIVPVSAGMALAHQLRDTDRIAVVFIGDGTLGEGAVYEAFNIASKWRCRYSLYSRTTSTLRVPRRRRRWPAKSVPVPPPSASRRPAPIRGTWPR